ncbi:MAG: hypothetical protein V4444_10485 [Pseudomonadota bacterium]
MTDEQAGEGSEPATGANKRKVPRWVIAFLRALDRCGDVRASAADAGVDHSTAYARRRVNRDFAAAWERALEKCRMRSADEEQQAIEALAAGRLPGSAAESYQRGDDMLPGAPATESGEMLAPNAGGGAQIKRRGEGRWSPAKEKRFFEELAATANVKSAAAAAGVSPNAVYARRMKQPLFKAQWAAVLETGQAAIEMKLVEAANRSFDPDDLTTGAIEPRVNTTEAIRIVQLGSRGKPRSEQDYQTLEEQAAAMSQDEIDELRQRLLDKLQRLREREMPARFAEGWSLDKDHDQMIPPGWRRIED